MSVRKSIARVLIQSATRHPPAGRETWALAMRREFEALDEDHLGWALGCWMTAAGWALRREWLYVALLLVGPYLLQMAWSMLTMTGYLLAGKPDWMDRLFTPLAASADLFTGLVFGAYRPRRAWLSAVAVALIPMVEGWIEMWLAFGTPLWGWLGPKATIFMLPAWLGLVVMLALCAVGARLGAFARRRLA